jgi:phosphoglycolate phosphatase
MVLRPPKSSQSFHQFTNGLTVIFDLDGTLADTAPDLLAALNHTLEDLTDDFLTLDHARAMVGQGALALIKDGMAHLGLTERDADVGALLDKFLVYYYDNVANTSKLFPGIEALLPRYLEAGVRLGVCTNKLEKPSRKLLRELGVHDHFHTIVGRDTLSTSKPDPKTLIQTVERVGGSLKRTVFLGDSITDVNTAKAAGVPCILVSFGYTLTPVQELGGDVIIDHFDELDEAIAALSIK